MKIYAIINSEGKIISTVQASVAPKEEGCTVVEVDSLDKCGGTLIDGVYTEDPQIATDAARKAAWEAAMADRIASGPFVEDATWKACVNLNAKSSMDDMCWSAIVAAYP